MTLPDTTKWLLPDDGHFSLAQLRLYQEERLSATARHQVEKHLLDCELCADVLTGMAVSNRTQTLAAVSQINTQIKNKVQPEQHLKVRPLYGPIMRVAAALVILLVSLGVFRYWQQATLAPAPENTMAQQPAVKPESEPLAVVSAPPDPVIKPAAPEPLEPVKTKIRSQARKVVAPPKAETSQPALAAASTAEEGMFPIDTAAVLDAFAVKTADTPTLEENNSLPGIITKSNSLAVKRALTAAPATDKPMGISLQNANTFTGQTITGKVLDAASNQGLPGVTVQVKNTPLGVATDAEGNFSITLPTGKDKLVFNFIGYKTQEIKINPADNLLAVQLSVDAKQLNEVVVSALGKESVPAAIIPAKPEGGRQAFNLYLQKNLRYPPEARQQKLEGRVKVSFTVDTNGQLTNFKILKSLSPACDAEAIRLIKEGPAWQPQLSRDISQSETVQVTVPFKLK